MARVRSAACSAASSPRLWARDRWPGKKCHGATQKVEHKLALNADAEAFLKEVFSRLDKDGSGAVSKHELQDALKALNELGDRGRSATEAAADLSEMFPDEEEITEEQLAAVSSCWPRDPSYTSARRTPYPLLFHAPYTPLHPLARQSLLPASATTSGSNSASG